MNYMIAGGGTGGHIFPAIAIGEALCDRVADARIYFVGTRYGMEGQLLPKLGYPLLTLPIRGFLGKSIAKKLALLWRLPLSLAMSLALLRRYRPKAVIGVGGYASAPLLWMARLTGTPTMIQEQNAFPGLVNRISSRFVKLACLGFPEAARSLRCPCVVTGNPVRKGFAEAPRWTTDRDELLILGGSQGAVALNQTLPALLKRWLPADAGLRVKHQCGARHVAAVEAAYRGAPFPVAVVPFIDNMSEAMARARLAICRAGASTIAELKLAGLPAALIPFPHAAHDHQRHNAESLAGLGAAALFPESSLADAGEALAALATDRPRLAAMAAAYPSATADSAGLCADIALALQNRTEVVEIVKEYETHFPQS